MAVVPLIDSSRLQNLTIEKLIALFYAAQCINDRNTTITFPTPAIQSAFDALPESMKKEIFEDIPKAPSTPSRSWGSWLSSFFRGE